MSKNTRWSSDDFRKMGLIEVPGKGFVKSAKLVTAGKVDKIEPVGNRKIKNAAKSVVDGVKFDSNLEKYMYERLKGAGVTFEFQVEYLLQEKFRYRGEAVRAITLTVDFVLPIRNIIIDTKGFQTQQGTMRYKMLKSVLKHIHDSEPAIEMPSNKKECDELLNRILYDKQP